MIAAALAITVGELVTFKLDRADTFVRCGHVTHVQELPGGVPGAWVVEAGDAPRRMVSVQLVDLRRGCAP